MFPSSSCLDVVAVVVVVKEEDENLLPTSVNQSAGDVDDNG